MSVIRCTVCSRSALKLEPILVRHASTSIPPRPPPRVSPSSPTPTPRPTPKLSASSTSEPSGTGAPGPSETQSRPRLPQGSISSPSPPLARPKLSERAPAPPRLPFVPKAQTPRSQLPATSTTSIPKEEAGETSKDTPEEEFEKRSLYQSYMLLTPRQRIAWALIFGTGGVGLWAMDKYAFADKEPELSTILDRPPEPRKPT